MEIDVNSPDMSGARRVTITTGTSAAGHAGQGARRASGNVALHDRCDLAGQQLRRGYLAPRTTVGMTRHPETVRATRRTVLGAAASGAVAVLWPTGARAADRPAANIRVSRDAYPEHAEPSIAVNPRD